jgi:hypothetical protein
MIKYKCTTEDCSWVGYEDEMGADFMTWYDAEGNYEDESWSNWICPKCGTWHQSLEDGYEEIYESPET